MKFSKFKQLEYTNSKSLPSYIVIRDGDKLIYKWWVGFGWVDVDPTPAIREQAIEITED